MTNPSGEKYNGEWQDGKFVERAADEFVPRPERPRTPRARLQDRRGTPLTGGATRKPRLAGGDKGRNKQVSSLPGSPALRREASILFHPSFPGFAVAGPDRIPFGLKNDPVVLLDQVIVFHPRQVIPLRIAIPDHPYALGLGGDFSLGNGPARVEGFEAGRPRPGDAVRSWASAAGTATRSVTGRASAAVPDGGR